MPVLFFIDVLPTRWGGYYWAARCWLQIEERFREFFATDTRLTKADKTAIEQVLPTQWDSKILHAFCFVLHPCKTYDCQLEDAGTASVVVYFHCLNDLYKELLVMAKDKRFIKHTSG